MILLFRVLAEIKWHLYPGMLWDEVETRGVEVAAGVDDKGRMALSFKAPSESGSNLEKVCEIINGRLACERPNRVLPALSVGDLVAYLCAAADAGPEQSDINGLPKLSYLPSWLPELAAQLKEEEYWVAVPGFVLCSDGCDCPDCEGCDDGASEPTPADYSASVTEPETT